MAQEEPFWTHICTNYLDFPTLREKFRADLSEGREHPVTMDEVCQMAVAELGFNQMLTRWFDDEISRPMIVLSVLWAARTFPGPPALNDLMEFGMVIAEGCGDAGFGPVTRPRERKAWQIIKAIPWNDRAH